MIDVLCTSTVVTALGHSPVPLYILYLAISLPSFISFLRIHLGLFYPPLTAPKGPLCWASDALMAASCFVIYTIMPLPCVPPEIPLAFFSEIMIASIIRLLLCLLSSCLRTMFGRFLPSQLLRLYLAPALHDQNGNATRYL
jgi:hypothetical protein